MEVDDDESNNNLQNSEELDQRGKQLKQRGDHFNQTLNKQSEGRKRSIDHATQVMQSTGGDEEAPCSNENIHEMMINMSTQLELLKQNQSTQQKQGNLLLGSVVINWICGQEKRCELE